MPTINDLRTVLRDGERFAGDPDAVLRAVQRRRRRATPSHAWILSAAAVAVLGVATAVVVGASHGGSQPSGPAASTQAATRPISSAHSATTVPANALRWDFTVDPIPGYTFAYEGDQPDRASGQQNGSVTSTTNPDVSAGITVYPRGAFDPSHGSVDATAVHGKAVTINGHPGTFVAGPSTPTLFWTYADDAWASIGVTTTDPGDALPLALQVARAVRTGSSIPVTLPFRVGLVPAPLRIVALGPVSGRGAAVQATAFYGTSFDAADGIYLTVTRISAARAAELKRVPVKGTRQVTRHLSDGSTLRVTVEPSHLDAISQSELDAIAASIDTSPTLTDPSNWFPVVP